MKVSAKCIACVSDKALLTLLSGGGGGKSSTSMLAALLLHKLFRPQHEGDQLRRRTFLKERDKRHKMAKMDFQINLALRNVSIHHKLGASGLAYVSKSASPTTLVIKCYSITAALCQQGSMAVLWSRSGTLFVNITI